MSKERRLNHVLRRVASGDLLSREVARAAERRGLIERDPLDDGHRRSEWGRPVGPRRYVYKLSAAGRAALALDEGE